MDQAVRAPFAIAGSEHLGVICTVAVLGLLFVVIIGVAIFRSFWRD